MWYGKVGLILFLFSLATLFSTYFLNQVFNDPSVSSNATFSSLQSIMNSFTAPGTPNTSLVFGDFMSAYIILFNLFTGSIFSSVFGATGVTAHSGIGFLADAGLGLLMGIMFDSGLVFFILYIISNRSI